tara:strand:- start:1051 stop:1815 length:765 start_codon:yes stop_codon:yes gene_type:complete
MIEITQIPALKDNYIYIVIDKDTKKTACIDPSESQPVLLFLEQNGITLDYILNTHHHSDHVGGNLELKKETGCQVVGPEIDKKRIPGIDICLKHNEEFKLGKTVLNVFEIPGHTLGHICFYSKTNNALFCGDTLFSLGCGRMFEGSPEQMWNSLKLLRCLPDETIVYCAHEYSLSNSFFAIEIDPDNKCLQKKVEEIREKRKHRIPTVPTLLSEEKKTNPFLRVDDKSFTKKLGFYDKIDYEIFAKIRLMKDNF